MFLTEKFKTSIDWVDLIIKLEKELPQYAIFTEPNLEEVQDKCEFIFYDVDDYFGDEKAIFRLNAKNDGSSITVLFGREKSTLENIEELKQFIKNSLNISQEAENATINEIDEVIDMIEESLNPDDELDNSDEDPTEEEIPQSEDAPVSIEQPQEEQDPRAINGIYDLLMEIQKDELATIQKYNSMIVTCEAEGYEDIAKIIRHITDEENIHVGMVQAAAQTISTMAREIKKGEQETIDILNGEEVHD